MQEPEARATNPVLKEIVVEASQALARLDAPRLEELALSCQVLTRTLNPKDARARQLLAEQAREAETDMAVFARVLQATRANLNVMNRLRELRAGRVEYTERQVRRGTTPGSPLTAEIQWAESRRAECQRGGNAEGNHGLD